MIAVGKTVENDARRVAQKVYSHAPRILCIRASQGNGILFVPPSLLSFLPVCLSALRAHFSKSFAVRLQKTVSEALADEVPSAAFRAAYPDINQEAVIRQSVGRFGRAGV